MAYRPTPKTEAKKAAMRARLLASARQLFVEQGYERTTLQQIVAAAGTSIGNCYFYFPNKEALLVAIAEEFRAEIEWRIDAAIAGVPFGPGLLAVAVYRGALSVLEQADIARVAFSDAALPPLRRITMELFAARVQRAFAAAPNLFAAWPEATAELAAHAWQGAANYVLEDAINGRLQADPDQVARFLARWNLQALGLSGDRVREGLAALPQHDVEPTNIEAGKPDMETQNPDG
jgi:AcrR family transcriptional regulator